VREGLIQHSQLSQSARSIAGEIEPHSQSLCWASSFDDGAMNTPLGERASQSKAGDTGADDEYRRTHADRFAQRLSPHPMVSGAVSTAVLDPPARSRIRRSNTCRTVACSSSATSCRIIPTTGLLLSIQFQQPSPS